VALCVAQVGWPHHIVAAGGNKGSRHRQLTAITREVMRQPQ
jgi:hypothetical protein